MANYYDRYSRFKDNGKIEPVPGIFLSSKSSDKQILYKLGQTRLDDVSNTYYGSPYYSWLILSANPEFGGLEFNIPDRTVIRIPYPFNASLEEYSSKVKKHIRLYG